tara:strand:- start:10996 stop:11310 length:315 start_codon:yes stop_codon:yes gene_type:complete
MALISFTPDQSGTLYRCDPYTKERAALLRRKELKMQDPRKLAIRLFLTMPFVVASTPAAIGAVHGIERSETSEGQQHPRGADRSSLTADVRRTGQQQDDSSDEE